VNCSSSSLSIVDVPLAAVSWSPKKFISFEDHLSFSWLFLYLHLNLIPLILLPLSHTLHYLSSCSYKVLFFFTFHTAGKLLYNSINSVQNCLFCDVDAIVTLHRLNVLRKLCHSRYNLLCNLACCTKNIKIILILHNCCATRQSSPFTIKIIVQQAMLRKMTDREWGPLKSLGWWAPSFLYVLLFYTYKNGVFDRDVDLLGCNALWTCK
jgi:hypothetical protein